jgi:hypothetical protein
VADVEDRIRCSIERPGFAGRARGGEDRSKTTTRQMNVSEHITAAQASCDGESAEKRNSFGVCVTGCDATNAIHSAAAR